MRYRAVTRIAKEWLKLDLVSAREYKKVCRFIAKDLLIDLRSIFLEMEWGDYVAKGRQNRANHQFTDAWVYQYS